MKYLKEEMNQQNKGYLSFDAIITILIIATMSYYFLIVLNIIEEKNKNYILNEQKKEFLLEASEYYIRYGYAYEENKILIPNKIRAIENFIYKGKEIEVSREFNKGCIYRLVIYNNKPIKLYFCDKDV